MKKTVGRFIIFVLALLPMVYMQAQVTIGSQETTSAGALLDLKEYNDADAVPIKALVCRA